MVLVCGRYARSSSDAEIVTEFDVVDVVDPALGPSWNIAPTQPVRVVLDRDQNSSGEPGGQGADGPVRQLRTARWGLVPAWAKDPSIASRLVNARAETITDKPSFRSAARSRRCLLPADGYYEWQKVQGSKTKTPYFLSAGDGSQLAFAGLYERWRDPERAEDDPARVRWTVTVVTTTAPDALGQIHDRCPVLVPPDLYADWLDPATTKPEDVRELLAALPEPRLHPVRVGPTVGNVRNDRPDLVQPVDPSS